MVNGENGVKRGDQCIVKFCGHRSSWTYQSFQLGMNH